MRLVQFIVLIAALMALAKQFQTPDQATNQPVKASVLQTRLAALDQAMGGRR